jgi:arsenate reductase-like glutaredoxin family protein
MLPEWCVMMTIQVFGLRSSNPTRAAERFFKERRAAVQMVDLQKKPMAAGEIRRFVERFGWAGLVDTEGKPYIAAGLKYMRLADSDWMARAEQEPGLLKLPLVRPGNRLSVGQDEQAWRKMLEGEKPMPVRERK